MISIQRSPSINQSINQRKECISCWLSKLINQPIKQRITLPNKQPGSKAIRTFRSCFLSTCLSSSCQSLSSSSFSLAACFSFCTWSLRAFASTAFEFSPIFFGILHVSRSSLLKLNKKYYDNSSFVACVPQSFQRKTGENVQELLKKNSKRRRMLNHSVVIDHLAALWLNVRASTYMVTPIHLGPLRYTGGGFEGLSQLRVRGAAIIFAPPTRDPTTADRGFLHRRGRYSHRYVSSLFLCSAKYDETWRLFLTRLCFQDCKVLAHPIFTWPGAIWSFATSLIFWRRNVQFRGSRFDRAAEGSGTEHNFLQYFDGYTSIWR